MPFNKSILKVHFNEQWINILPSYFIRFTNLKCIVNIDAEFPNEKHKKTTKHGTIDKSNLAVHLQLKKNANVMLIHNIDISDGLVNGVTGKLIFKNLIILL